MRVVFVTLLIAALAAVGFFLYQRSAPSGAQSGMFAPPAAAPPPTAEACATENAFYKYNDDRRLTLRRLPSRQEIEIASIGGRLIPNMPDLIPRLIRDHIDLAPGVFRFQRCESAAPATAPSTAP
jgi:hypothetical protein